MGKGYILRWRRDMSPDDRQTFDRWMKRNAVAGAIFAAAFIAMAVLGSQPATPPETALASGSKAAAVDATVALK